MRITKEANERKTEILDAAGALFIQKGYDATTISDIIANLKVARGLVYYHFKSKEDILDAYIGRMTAEFLIAAQEAAADKTIPVMARLLQTLMSLKAGEDTAAAEVSQHIHKPQNALMHQKVNQALLMSIPPILTEIIQDGISEGIFNTPYPYETIELIMAYVTAVLNDDTLTLSKEGRPQRITAFIFNLERLSGAAPGSFAAIQKLF